MRWKASSSEIADEPDDDVLEALEAEYEALMQEQMQRAEARPDWGSHQVASLQHHARRRQHRHGALTAGGGPPADGALHAPKRRTRW